MLAKAKILSWTKKNSFFILLGAILLVGIFLRVWHFSDWLHFELDQARDAKVIDLAIKEGPSHLPLLGPRAGGTYLRLGPAFYYLEYLSALVFGGTPAGMAGGVLVFSLLSLPLFFLFCREYFDRKISLGLLAIFSGSLYLVVYSRFAWNPNLLPFFVLLFLYAFLKLANKEKLTEKKKLLWFCVLAGTLSINAQLHFVAMIVLGIFSLVFFLYVRPKLNWKIWLAGVGVFLVFSTPMILNDVKTGGKNAQEFFKAITKKSNKHGGSFLEKLGANYIAHGSKYFLILTGKETTSLARIKFPKNNIFKADFVCQKEACRRSWPIQLASIVFFSFCLFVLGNRLKKEKDQKKRNFLFLIAIFMATSFVALTPLAKNLAPRFFLFGAFMPFLLLGLVLEYFQEKFPKRKNWVFGVVAIFVLTSLWNTAVYFQESISATQKAKKVDTEMIINESSRITLELQQAVNDYMKSFQKQNGEIIYLSAPAQYQRSLIYLLEKDGASAEGFKGNLIGGKVYRQGNYFAVAVTLSNVDKALKKHLGGFDLVEKKDLGNFVVFRFQPKESAINAEKQIKTPPGVPIRRVDLPPRFNWFELFK